jgi:hypothetical protein
MKYVCVRIFNQLGALASCKHAHHSMLVLLCYVCWVCRGCACHQEPRVVCMPSMSTSQVWRLNEWHSGMESRAACASTRSMLSDASAGTAQRDTVFPGHSA